MHSNSVLSALAPVIRPAATAWSHCKSFSVFTMTSPVKRKEETSSSSSTKTYMVIQTTKLTLRKFLQDANGTSNKTPRACKTTIVTSKSKSSKTSTTMVDLAARQTLTRTTFMSTSVKCSTNSSTTIPKFSSSSLKLNCSTCNTY